MFENRFNMLAGHPGKPFEKLVNSRAVFQILEQRLHRNARPLEEPDAADLTWHTFYRWTVAPVDHGIILWAPQQRMQLRRHLGYAPHENPAGVRLLGRRGRRGLVNLTWAEA